MRSNYVVYVDIMLMLHFQNGEQNCEWLCAMNTFCWKLIHLDKEFHMYESVKGA